MASAKPRERAEKLARAMIDGYPRALTDGATHFHATYVSPRWARQMTRTAAIGHHLFYRPGPVRAALRRIPPSVGEVLDQIEVAAGNTARIYAHATAEPLEPGGKQ